LDLSLSQAAEQLRELLIDAVRLQLRADVPVGAYLSGGLDSSGIVAVAGKFACAPLKTFSVAFADPEYDEREYQDTVARHLGAEHVTLHCSDRDIGEIFPRVVWHTELVVLPPPAAPLMLLSQLVRAHGFKVVLTGEGGDEVFGGYDLFKESKIRRFWSAHPQSHWRPLLLTRLYPYLRHSPVTNVASTRWFFGQGLQMRDNAFYAHAPRWTATRSIWRFLSADARAELANFNPEDELASQLPAEIDSWSALARDQYVEVKTLLQGYLLASQSDRVGMANAVEGRVPYLDHRVIEFANQLSPRYKLRGLKEKVVLREALSGLLPEKITGRTKQPYRAPDSKCFFPNGRPLAYVAELTSSHSVSRSGYFEPRAVHSLVEKCRSGRALGAADNMAFVGILSTLLLHTHFIEKGTTG
jgi:asparagine synthase (glutamine-hydrolysing)